nr:uncharacterized protein LOC109781338 isoform X1 [Aegilops tauschii subsp. strangulata]
MRSSPHSLYTTLFGKRIKLLYSEFDLTERVSGLFTGPGQRPNSVLREAEGNGVLREAEGPTYFTYFYLHACQCLEKINLHALAADCCTSPARFGAGSAAVALPRHRAALEHPLPKHETVPPGTTSPPTTAPHERPFPNPRRGRRSTDQPRLGVSGKDFWRFFKAHHMTFCGILRSSSSQ